MKGRGRSAVGLGVALAVLPLGTAAATVEDVAVEVVEPGPRLEVRAEPVVGAGSDLVRVDDGPGAALFFSPVAPVRQVAVHDVVVRNTGDVALRDLSVAGDRGGPFTPEATVLAPGEQVVVRSELPFSFQEVASGLAGILTSRIDASAVADVAGVATDVAATTELTLGLVAVLSTPRVLVELSVVGVDDVAVGDDVATVRWTADEAVARTPRLVRHRVSVRNDSTVALEGVEVTAPGLATPLVLLPPGETLAPGADVVVDFVRPVTADMAGLVPGPTDLRSDLVTDASVTARDVVLGSVVTELDDVTLLAVVDAIVLPAAGPPRLGELVLLAMLSLGFGAALLVAEPRRPAPEVIRRRTAAAGRPPHRH